MILTVRIEKQEKNRLEEFARKKRLNRTQAVKELLESGFMLSQLQEYKEGNLSLERLSEALDVSVIEALSLVGRYNAHPRMPRDYISDAREFAQKLQEK
ncbi:MAG: hypothetical protein PHC61_06900 [Chitinivibrionales bacterium]|nr:hypothetical protein [Chitinivibrionales bacterium]